MPDLKPGDRLEVVDATTFKGGRKLPFAKGAMLTFKAYSGDRQSVALRECAGYWKRQRFEVRRG